MSILFDTHFDSFMFYRLFLVPPSLWYTLYVYHTYKPTGVKGASPFFSSSDESEVDEVHHMHDSRSSHSIISPDNQDDRFAHRNGCTIIRGTTVTAAVDADGGVDHQRHQQERTTSSHDDSGNNMVWEERGRKSSGNADPVAVMHLPTPTHSNPGPGVVVGNNHHQPIFSPEPEDLMNKSLIRQDPRLLSRSGVYREKSVCE